MGENANIHFIFTLLCSFKYALLQTAKVLEGRSYDLFFKDKKENLSF